MPETELNLKDAHFFPLLSTLESSHWAFWTGHASHRLARAVSATVTSESRTPGPSLATPGTWPSWDPLRVTADLVCLSFIFTFFLLHLPIGHCQLGIPVRLEHPWAILSMGTTGREASTRAGSFHLFPQG